MARIAGQRRGGETYPEGARASGGGVSDGLLVWRPDGAGDVKTWLEVMNAINQSKGPLTVFCPQLVGPPTPVYQIPPGAGSSVLYDVKGSQIVAPRGPHDARPMQILRGATVQNLARLAGGVRLQTNKHVGDPPALTFTTIDPALAVNLVVDDGAEIKNLSTAETGMIVVDPAVSQEFYLVFNQLGNADLENGAFQTVQALAGSILNIVALSGGISLDTIQRSGWLGSEVGATVNWIHDGTMAFPDVLPPVSLFSGYHPNNLGTNVNQPTGLVGGVGPTAFRPKFQGGGNPSFGCMYVDTDLSGPDAPGKPIWFNLNGTTGWIDATGTAA